MNDLTVVRDTSSAVIEIEKSVAIERLQLRFLNAKRFPRDENVSAAKILEACKRFPLATKAFYCYQRGDQVVKDLSIRMAEEIARLWKHMDYGWAVIERRSGVTTMEAFCWDLENNVQQSRRFEVPHEFKAHGKIKRLVDPRDIKDWEANQAARYMRSCILALIPADIKDEIRARCDATIAAGAKTSMPELIRRMIGAFAEIGVSEAMIEKRLKHKLDVATAEEVSMLSGIYNAIRDKQARREEYFEFVGDEKVEDFGSDKVENFLAKLGG